MAEHPGIVFKDGPSGRRAALAFGPDVSYQSLVDFVPAREPYEFATDVDLQPVSDGTRVVMSVEPLHDQVWTQRLLEGRANELDNLARVLGA